VEAEVVMTKAMLIALTAVVWTGGFVTTGALVRTLHHPITPPASITVVDRHWRSPAPVALVPQTPQAEERVIVLPTVEIVARIPRATPSPPPSASVRELTCGVWKPLLQGGGAVQICE
jgi:hypothetical protein